MAYLLKQVDWYQDGELVDSFKDIVKMNLKLSSDGKPTSAEITLVNSLDRQESGVYLHKYVNAEQEMKFKEGDTIKIFLRYAEVNTTIDATSTSPDFIMTAEIAEVQINVEGGKSTIKLTCTDKTFSLLSKIWNYNYDTAENKTAPQVIQHVIQHISDEVSQDSEAFDASGNISSSDKLYGIDARLIGGTTYPGTPGDPPAYIQSRRPDDSTFGAVTIAKVFKPAYEFIKELSTPDYTNTAAELSEDDPTNDPIVCKRNYIFYIDYENRFHWFYPQEAKTNQLDGALTSTATTVTVDSTTGFMSRGRIQIGSELIDYTGTGATNFTGCTRGVNNTTAAAHDDDVLVYSDLYVKEGDTTTGHTVYKFKLTKKTFDIVNMVIYNSGQDLFGSGILWYYYYEATKSKELKMTYKPWRFISRDLIQKEINDGRLTKDNSTPGPFTHAGNYYKETTGDYDGGSGITPGWGGSAVTSDATYNTSLRNAAAFGNESDGVASKGKTKAEAYCKNRGSPRWRGTIELKGERFTPGELITFTSASAGILNESLRIKSVSHNIEKRGWFTTLNVEEDEKEIQS